jgi:large subunit ribosomal protein L37Ae
MGRSAKKVGSVARFGPRYGVKIRRQIQEIEKKQKVKHPCPNCNHKSVKRVGSGIWQCAHCDCKFAGGAYFPNMPKKKIELKEVDVLLDKPEKKEEK